MFLRLPRLRLAGLALPLLTAGCMSGVMPGAEAPDPSCVLLCALTRAVTGDAAPQPVAVAATPAPPTRHPARRHVARLRPPNVTKSAKPAPPKPRRVEARVHVRSVLHKAATEVSVVPQAPARRDPPKPVAIVPTAPIAAAPAPAAAPRTLSEAIPGSAGIMVPNWQSQ